MVDKFMWSFRVNNGQINLLYTMYFNVSEANFRTGGIYHFKIVPNYEGGC